MLMTASFFVLMLAQSEPSTVLLAGAMALTVGLLLASRVSFAPSTREIRVGARAREHSELLRALPAPQHPDTDGRPRSRAPSQVVSATVFSAA